MAAQLPTTPPLIDTSSFQPPRWLLIGTLPPLVVGGSTLHAQQMAGLIAALRSSTLAAPHRALGAIRADADRSTLDALLWCLVDQWEAHGSPAGGQWIVTALGLLGGDAVALELARRIGGWREAGRYEVITQAMESLAAIGSPVALRLLGEFAAEKRFPSLKSRAIDSLEVVPLVGSDSSEGAATAPQARSLDTFDFGSRRFFLILDRDSAPALCDEQGRVRPTLPKPLRGDDPVAASLANERWKSAKKTLAEAVHTQVVRLEQAMVDEQRWHSAQWVATIRDHPLIGSLARRLLWAGYNAAGVLQSTFCLSDDSSAVTVDYATVDPEQYHAIGLPHPLHLPDELRRQWVEVLMDFQISPPFAQASRPTYHLPLQPEQTSITMFQGCALKQRSIRQLRERQWKSTAYEDLDGATVFYTLRRFPGARITAVMRTIREHQLTGGDVSELPQECYFVSGQRADYSEKKKKPTARIPLDKVSPVIISEVLLDWTTLVHDPNCRIEA